MAQNYCEIELWHFSFLCALPVSFYKITQPHVVCRQTMQHHHKLHCGPLQNLFLSFLIWSINQRLSPVSLCAAEEELELVDTEGPVVCWESLGLPDLDCDEKPGWISSSSLAGELIQPGPQEVWTQPTHKQTLPLPGEFTENQQRVRERETERDWTRDMSRRTEEDPRRDSQRHCTLRWRGRKRLDRPSWDERRGRKKKQKNRATTRDWDESQM